MVVLSRFRGQPVRDCVPSLATVIVGLRGDRWGRRRVLIALMVMSACGYLALAVFADPLALTALAFVGMLNGMGRDRGAQSALDQAILSATIYFFEITSSTSVASCARSDFTT